MAGTHHITSTHRKSLLVRALVALVVSYTLLAGATFDGILNTERRLLSVVILGIASIVWLVMRWRGGWRWYTSDLDLPILLWCGAFTVSLLANAESWRRISIGLWFMALYVVTWYALQDMLANGKLRREWLVDALLIAGVPVAFVGFAQLQLALVSGMALPRPVGTLGNANSLAALLVLLLPLVAGRLFMARAALPRTLLGVYAAALLLLLLLSFSRGGWVGGAVALLVWAGLHFPLRRLWSKLSRARRRIALALVVLVGAAGVFVMVQTLELNGRGLDLRAWIYETALQAFFERPLTGTGLFTFGVDLARLNSLPPLEPHSHAHNLILHVAAELGVVGLLALGVSAALVLRAFLRLFHTRDAVSVMGAAAFAGFIAHQMFDLPAMMPALALVALVALLLFVTPAPLPTTSHQRSRWQPALVISLALLLTLSGIWSALNYRSFISALSDGAGRGAYRAAAERVQALANGDPALAIYPQQAGMLLSLAADEGDAPALREAIAQFRRYTALEPSYASGWANLAALYAAAGELTPAEDAMRKTVELAPQSWVLVYRYAQYAEAAGSLEVARQAYARALALNSSLFLLPDWNQSPLRREITIDEAAVYPPVRVLLLLERGDLAGARQLASAERATFVDFSANHVILALLAGAEGSQNSAEAALQKARALATDRNSRAWVYLGMALLEPAQFDELFANARLALQPALPTDADWALGANIGYIQYLSLAIPRQFVPQLGYAETDPALLRLLENPTALADLRSTLPD